jgi:hypothetical protein
MNKREFEGSRIVVELARKSLLNLGARNRKEDSRDDSRGRRGSFNKRRGPQPEDSCFNCGKTGHWYGS